MKFKEFRAGDIVMVNENLGMGLKVSDYIKRDMIGISGEITEISPDDSLSYRVHFGNSTIEYFTPNELTSLGMNTRKDV